MFIRKRSVGMFLVVGGAALTIGVGVSMVRTADGTLSGDPAAVESSLLAPPTTLASPIIPTEPTEGTVPAGPVAIVPGSVTAAAPTAEAPPDVPSSQVGDDSLSQIRSAAAAVDSEPLPHPSRLVIESLGVAAPIDPYGVDVDGQMDVPDNVTDVGWYEYGPTPGSSGSAVLAAHVDLAGQGAGVFFNLRELRNNDVVTVEYENGTSTEFRVVANSIYDKAELPLDAIFSRSGPPVLTLITCGGGFSRSARSYDSNVVVYAVPIAADSVPVTSAS